MYAEDQGLIPRSGILWRREWQPTPVFLPGESHGQRSLVGYSPWGCKESDTTEQQCSTHMQMYSVEIYNSRWYMHTLKKHLSRKRLSLRTSLVVQWLALTLPMQGPQVWSLDGKLRSHMPHGEVKKQSKTVSHIHHAATLFFPLGTMTSFSWVHPEKINRTSMKPLIFPESPQNNILSKWHTC